MARWLIKADPDDYGAGELARDGRTTWDGVSNALALQHLRAMQPGDELLVYHTAHQKAIVARAQVVSAARTDPSDPSGKRAVIDVEFVGWLATPLPLARLKSDPAFATFDLVRNSRLSVMPVPDALWDHLINAAPPAPAAHAIRGEPASSAAAPAGKAGPRRIAALRRSRHERPAPRRRR